MEKPVKPRSFLKVISLFLLVIIVVLAAAVPVFLKSAYFIGALEFFIQNRIHQPVEIGSLSVVNGHTLRIDEFVIREAEQGDMGLVLPRLQITLSLSGILDRTIDEVILENPKISLNLSRKKEAEPGRTTVSLPFMLRKGSVREGEAVLILDDARRLHVRSLNVSLEESGFKKSRLRGNALLDEINATVSLEAGVDTERFIIDEGRIEISETSLQALADLNIVPSALKEEIMGFVTLGIHISAEEKNSPDQLNWDLKMLMRDLTLHSESLRINITDGPFTAEARGKGDLEKGSVEIGVLKVLVPRLKPWTLSGAINNVYSGAPDINIQSSGIEMSLSAMKQIVSGPAVAFLDEMSGDASMTADISVDGNIGSPRAKGAAQVRGNELAGGKVKLLSFDVNLPFEYKNSMVSIDHAVVTAKEISMADNDLSVTLNSVALEIPHVGYSVQKADAEINGLTIGRAVISRDGKKYYEDKGIVLKGSVDGDLDRKLITVKGISVDTDHFDNLSARASVNMRKPVVIDAALELMHIDVEKVSRTFFDEILTDMEMTVHGTGALSADVLVTLPEQGDAHVHSKTVMTFADAGFSDAADSTVCEGLSAKITGQFDASLPLNKIGFTVESEASGFELLMGRFYGSFRDRALLIKTAGEYTLPDTSLHIAEASAGLTGIGTLFLSGDIANISGSPVLNAGIRFENISNRAVYDFFIRETFQEQTPLLSKLQISGTSSAGLFFRGTAKEFTVYGNIDVKHMDIEGYSELSVKGIDVSLPLDISYPVPGKDDGPGEFGVVRIKEVTRKDLSFTDLEIFPVLHKNALLFKEDIVLPVMGGEIIFRNAAYKNMLSPDRSLGLSIAIHNIDLREASTVLELPQFPGSLSGTIPHVSFMRNRLRTEGEVVLEFFDGSMTIGDFSMDNVFSPIASMKSTIAFDNIMLDKLTGTFDFGHISGILRGRIEDLVIVNGQAERFRASVGTFRKKGIKQKINVEALKKISILGTGSSSSLLDRGIYRLFKEYRYDKMGFSASLRNDNLFLEGVENRENVGYLVVGGLLPPKVDVITYNQNISFSEIVNRLKRISLADN